jgi:hypothetical protein
MKIRDFLIGVGAQVDRSSFNQAENATKSLKNGLYAVTGAIGALAGAGYIVKRFVDDVAKVGDETNKTARNLGANAEAFQEWRYVAGLAGVQTGDFSNAIKFLQRGIAEAGEGTGTALKGFQRLGISVKNNDGTLKSYDQILKEVAERLPQLNEAERVATSMDLFSRSGAKMIDMLMQGNEEIQRFRQRAQDLGIVMSVDMMNAMEEYNDRSEDFEAVIFGIKTQIANALIPSMTKFAVTLTNNLVPAIKWLKDNSEQLKSTLQFVGKAFLWVAGATALWGLGALTTGIIGLTSKLALMGWTGLMAWGKMLVVPLLVGAGILLAIAIIEDLYLTLTDPEAFTVSRLLWQSWSKFVMGIVDQVFEYWTGKDWFNFVDTIVSYWTEKFQSLMDFIKMISDFWSETFGSVKASLTLGRDGVTAQQDTRFALRYGAVPIPTAPSQIPNNNTSNKTTNIGTINITQPVDVDQMKNFFVDDFRAFTNSMEGN